MAGVLYEDVYERAMDFYRQNKKGDLEASRLLGVEPPKWHMEDEILYEVVPECLKRLRAKYKIGIIANQAPGARERLQMHGILQYIDLIAASAEEGVSKPDRRIFVKALERSGCSPERSVMIGDRIDNDIIPARQLGMKTVWVKQGFGRFWTVEKEEERADISVERIGDICGFLL